MQKSNDSAHTVRATPTMQRVSTEDMIQYVKALPKQTYSMLELHSELIRRFGSNVPINPLAKLITHGVIKRHDSNEFVGSMLSNMHTVVDIVR